MHRAWEKKRAFWRSGRLSRTDRCGFSGGDAGEGSGVDGSLSWLTMGTLGDGAPLGVGMVDVGRGISSPGGSYSSLRGAHFVFFFFFACCFG